MWRIPASTDPRSSSGSSRLASHWRPLTPNRPEHGALPFSRRCKTASISFFERVRERTSCSRRAKRRRITQQRSSGIQTRSSSPFHNSRANARASRRPVFARACAIPVSSGLTTTTRSTYGSRIRATCQQLPVTSSATRSLRSRLSAKLCSPSGVLGTRRLNAPHRPRRSRSRRSRGERPGRSRDRPTCHLTTCFTSSNVVVDNTTGEQRDNDTDPIRARSSIQASRRGGRTKSTGSKPTAENGLPVCVLPMKAPIPDEPKLRS